MSLPLPFREGVNPSTTFLPKGCWQTVLQYLCEKFPQVEEATWISRMKRNEVVTEDALAIKPTMKYLPQVRLYYYRELLTETAIPFKEEVIFENDEILVVDKPHFLPVIPSGNYLQQTLLVRLRKKFQLDELSPAHRLDRLTAGVILLTKHRQYRRKYQSLFLQKTISKKYEAISAFAPDEGLELPFNFRVRMTAGEPYYLMKVVDGQPNSETLISKTEQLDKCYVYHLSPVTGKKHQLRVHMAALGIPILNDPLYPQLQPYQNNCFTAPLKLLARSLAFTDPVSGKEHYFESERKLTIC